MILVLRFEGIPLDDLQSNGQALLCYGTTVGFSIIVSVDILKKLFSDKKEGCDEMEIDNIVAVVLFAVVGAIRLTSYHSIYSNITSWQNYCKITGLEIIGVTGEILDKVSIGGAYVSVGYLAITTAVVF